MKRVQDLVLVVAFLLIICAVPLAQAIIDVRVEGERKPVFLTLLDSVPSPENLRSFEDNLERSSTFQQGIRPLFQLARYYLLRDLGEKVLRGAKGWYFYAPGVRYLVEPYYRLLQGPGGGDPVEVIADFARQLASKKIELLLLPLPGKASVYPDRLVPAVRPGPELAAHTRRLVKELSRRGVNTLDLQPLFYRLRVSRPDLELFMRGDTHWTGEGARQAAAAVARWIAGRPWYRSLARTRRYVRREVKVLRRGDVPRMTRMPHQEQLFPGERVTCFRVFDTAGDRPYEEPDDPGQSPILVLGDSFSRVFQTDEPEAAGWIANLAYELQLPVSSIVNDGGASTLVRQELARDLDQLRGKRLVIWAFVERDIRFGLQGWRPIDLWPSGLSHRGRQGAALARQPAQSERISECQ